MSFGSACDKCYWKCVVGVVLRCCMWFWSFDCCSSLCVEQKCGFVLVVCMGRLRS